jgi:hypothetical protein
MVREENRVRNEGGEGCGRGMLRHIASQFVGIDNGCTGHPRGRTHPPLGSVPRFQPEQMEMVHSPTVNLTRIG